MAVLNLQKKYWGFVPVIGRSLGFPEYQHDDMGLSPGLTGELVEMSGANSVYIPCIEWRFLKPRKEDDIKRHLLEKMVLPLLRPGVEPFALSCLL